MVQKERQGVTILGLCGGKQMNSADRMVMIAARSQGILIDFVLVSLVRWGLKAIGLHYVYYQPVLRGASPPLTLADLAHPASALFYGGMYFVSGLPELIFAGMWCGYAIITISVFGQTFGMRNAGTILKDKKGGRPKFYQVIVRELTAPLSSIAWLGYWSAAFTRYPMALHDMISGTKIVYVEKPQQDG